ncbi:MAG TPA: hypothetical protein VJQ82_05330 [Terriglobales bacterium]|nr:hypothetical protein [Terriglobales bacterium]
MSRTNRNFVVAYILLVGLPLLALAGVLHAGRKLAAPISVDGIWKVELPGSSRGDVCSSAVVSTFDSPLQISQSGKSLLISIGKSVPAADGTIEGTNVKIALPMDSCGGAQGLVLTASVDPKLDPTFLSGFLSPAGCSSSSCGAIAFRAVRQPRTPSGGLR